jgi:hypothetical protein
MAYNQNQSEGYTEVEVEKITQCALHGRSFLNPCALAHTRNSWGYSMYAPPCNGCKIGMKEDEAAWKQIESARVARNLQENGSK